MDKARQDGSPTRIAILDATEALMIERGYAAVSARSVAARAGVKPATVQHHFRTMEALLLAVYRRAAASSLERQEAALAADRPLHALWTLSGDAARTGLAMEFMALANHRKTIRAEIARVNEAVRALHAAALPRLLAGTPLGSPDYPADGVALLLVGAARAMVMEGAVGIAGGHEAARGIIARLLDVLEPPPPA